MSTTNPLDGFCSGLEGMSHTDCWDMIVSGTLSQVNAALAKQPVTAGAYMPPPFDVPRFDPIESKIFTITYNLCLEEPNLTFVAGNPFLAELRIPFAAGSSYTVARARDDVKGTPQPLPRTHSILARVPLAAVDGDSAAMVGSAPHWIAVARQVPGAGIVLHFRNEWGAHFSIDPRPCCESGDLLEIQILAALDEYLQQQLAGLDLPIPPPARAAPAAEMTLCLSPKSLKLAGGGTGHDSWISIYIQTSESGNPPGRAFPAFCGGNGAISPIPPGHTASIILSRALLRDAFVSARLAKAGFTVTYDEDDHTKPDAAKGGITARLAKGTACLKLDEYGRSWSGLHIDGFRIPIDDSHPLLLALKDSGLEIDWSVTPTVRWSNSSPYDIYSATGAFNVDVTLKVTGTMTVSDDGVTVPDCLISGSSYAVNVSDRDFSSSLSRLQYPDIGFALHGIDWLATLCLFSSGRLPVQVDVAAGVRIPCDLVVVGTVA